MRKRLAILGSAGSIGTQSLDVVRAHSDSLQVVALSTGTNAGELLRQTAEFRPRTVHIGDEAQAARVARELNGSGIEVLSGPEGLCRIAAESDADMVVAATVGWTGVEPVLAAIDAGREIALANKEVLVCAGELVMARARERGVAIWPLDSEHNALMQCLDAGKASASAPIRRVILTCSGGPYRKATAQEIAAAGPERTLAHPTWNMGRKITVDSATLMNKGFEVIEAFHLFGLPLEQIQVVVHPQSIVHGIVEFVDGSMIAQMGPPDMRLPIQNVLTQPHRRPTTVAPLDLVRAGTLEFSEPDIVRFPCLRMAYDAAAAGGTMACVLNAANEIAVVAHLEGRIPCGAIAGTIREVLDCHENRPADSLPVLREADAWGRATARNVLSRRAG